MSYLLLLIAFPLLCVFFCQCYRDARKIDSFLFNILRLRTPVKVEDRSMQHRMRNKVHVSVSCFVDRSDLSGQVDG